MTEHDPELDDLRKLEQKDLREDLRRAQPNPPMTTPKADPTPEIDLGYAEDAEREDRWDGEARDTPVPAYPSDPLEADREEPDRPGSTLGE